MISAATKVFSVHELIERVLLYLNDDDPRQGSRSSKELFDLQRINHKTCGTIRTSPELGRRMGTEYMRRADVDYTDGPFVLGPYLKRQEPLMSPFRYKGAHDEPDHLTLVCEVDTAHFDRVRKAQYLHVGIQGPSKRVWAARYDSWRSLKISTREFLTTVIVNVKVQKAPLRIPTSPLDWPAYLQLTLMYNRACRKYAYKEWKHFDPGEGTLGDIVDLLEEIALRSPWKHLLLAQHKLDTQSVVGLPASF